MKWNTEKSIRLTLILTYVFMGLLIVGAIALPWLVTWYVEVRGKAPSLPTTVMLTCYPCGPFAAAILWSMRTILRSALKGETVTEKNAAQLNRMSWCCFVIMAVMLFSGRFYLPFYVCAICTAFMGLILRMIRGMIMAQLKTDAPEETNE